MITVYGYIGAPSAELREAVAGASLVVGGQRHLDALGVPDDRRIVLGRIGPAIDARAAGLKVRVVPTVTSLQLAFAAVALPWDDALLVSLHGNDPAPALEALRTHPKVGLLTDGRTGLPQIVVLVLAHHPDDAAAIGEQTAIAGGARPAGAEA